MTGNACTVPSRRPTAGRRGVLRTVAATLPDGTRVLECGHRVARPTWWHPGHHVPDRHRCEECGPPARSDADAERYAQRVESPKLTPPKLTPRCEHGLGVDDCRECLPDGFTVDEFCDAFPDGGTIDEIANVLGISHEWVRQLEIAARAKLGPGAEALRPEGVRIPSATWDRRVLRALESGNATTAELVEMLGDEQAVTTAIARLRASGRIGNVPGSQELDISRF